MRALILVSRSSVDVHPHFLIVGANWRYLPQPDGVCLVWSAGCGRKRETLPNLVDLCCQQAACISIWYAGSIHPPAFKSRNVGLRIATEIGSPERAVYYGTDCGFERVPSFFLLFLRLLFYVRWAKKRKLKTLGLFLRKQRSGSLFMTEETQFCAVFIDVFWLCGWTWCSLLLSREFCANGRDLQVPRT